MALAMVTRPVLVFDVNETLLDLDALKPHFARIFGDAAVLREWFAQLVLYSGALSLAGTYEDFSVLGGAVLRMIAASRGMSVTDADRVAIRDAIAAMPPHPEVPDALRRLRDAGFRMVTLTNNPAAVCDSQLQAAGIRANFERLFSIDEGPRRYKPAPETYALVRDALDVSYADLCMVACHTWDTLGAAAIGMHAALIERPGNAPLPVGPQPDFVIPDLAAFADQILARYPS